MLGCTGLLKVYPCLDPFEVYERARPWINKQRWYPRGLGEYTVLDAWRIGCNIYAAILRVGSIKLFLPISISDVPPPSNLSPERYERANGYYVYEAEFDPRYHELFFESRLSGIKVDVLDNRLRGSSIKCIEAIETNSTNTLVKVSTSNGSYVLKSYRSLSRYNLEPLFLKYLSGRSVVPSLYASAVVKDNYVTIAMKYLDAVGDGGYPFYLSIRKSLDEREVVVPVEDIGKLTLTVALFHEEMGRCRSWWCGKSRITSSDVDRWARRIKSYYEKAKTRTHKLRGELRRLSLSLLMDAQPRVEEAMKLMKEFKGKTKIRNHQDLHLGQTLYTRDGKFYLIDFEGEPGRGENERLALEPALRDLACIIRSIGYIAVFGLKDHLNKDFIETARDLLDDTGEARIAKKWARETASMFLKGYLEKVMGVGIMIHGIGGSMLLEWAEEAINAWIVERALYEYMYELNFRTGYSIIPLLGLAGILP